jgi:SAM-dependent methyltransferase
MSFRNALVKRHVAPSLPYDAIGALYDHPSHIEPAIGFFRAIKPLLKSLKGQRVLDLGCGTGLLSERLAQHGCVVVAIDGASHMLEVARARCRRFRERVRFVHADLRTFREPQASKGAFASGDVVSHLQSPVQLRTFFRRVRQSLTSGGVFVFDALNRWCFENYWAERTYYFEGKQGDMVMECRWDKASGIGTARTVVYEKLSNGMYIRRRGVIRERWFADDVIRRALKDAGFVRTTVMTWSPWEDQKEEESLDRLLWTARA